jgi:hypothetical protein
VGLTPYAWQKLCNFGIMFYDMIAGALRPDPAAGQAEAFGTAIERMEPVWWPSLRSTHPTVKSETGHIATRTRTQRLSPRRKAAQLGSWNNHH